MPKPSLLEPCLNPQILIVTPFRNEDHSIPQYLKALKAVEYPKELIDLYWLENDSSDKTLSILKEAQPKMPFKSTILKSINIIGPRKKRSPGEYSKDVWYGGGRRRGPWLVIWNDHFLPMIGKSRVSYVLAWYADAVAPPNIITEYLKVFSKHKDAGWAGGAMHCRYPLQNRLASPRPREHASSRKIVQVSYTSHCWMCPRSALAKTKLYRTKGRDIHQSLIKDLGEQGLKTYYQPSVYLKHISTDEKIYRNKLY